MKNKDAVRSMQPQMIGEMVNGRPAIQISRNAPLPSRQASREFRVWPRAVSRAFRDLLLARYPALDSHEHSRQYLRLTQHILFNAAREPETGDILLPFHHVQAVVEDWRHARGHAAQDWIDKFSHDVFPLEVTPYRYTEGQARTVEPEIADELLRMIGDGRARGEDGDRVDFVSGEPVSSRALRKAQQEREKHFRDLVLTHLDNPTHPAHELLDYLNGQSQNYLERVLKRNWPQVRRAAENLPEKTKRECARKWPAFVRCRGAISVNIRCNHCGDNQCPARSSRSLTLDIRAAFN